MSQFINIMGRRVPCHLENIDISDLKFLADNPRVFHSTHRKNNRSDDIQDQIFSSLYSLGSTKILMNDIYQNGGILEEIIVRDSTVLEGNSRLASYRSLRTMYPDDARWRRIPAKIIDQEVSDQESAYLLASYHIKGKASWDAFEKAGFIYRTMASLDGSEKTLAAQFGHKKSTIEAMAAAYNTMTGMYLRKYCSENESGTWIEKYSYFETLYRSKDLRNIIEADPLFLDSFCKWVQQDVFPKAETVRKLPIILRDDVASKIFYETAEKMPTQAFCQAWNTVAQQHYMLGKDNPIREFDNYLKNSLYEAGADVRTLSSTDRLRLKRIQNYISEMLTEQQ